MTEVTTTRKFAGHDKGDTINVSPASAAYLVTAGYAEAIEDTGESKPKRGRPRKTEEAGPAEEVGGASPSGSAQTAG